jgi:alpha-L-fucosidase 2
MPSLSATLAKRLLSVSGLALALVACAAAPTPPRNATLWYRQPAADPDPAAAWVEALPVGNGRLGAMIFGGVGRERLQLNEDTLWAGGPYDPNHAGAAGALATVRRLVFDGKYEEAEKLIDERMMSTPLKQLPYQTVGNLYLDFAHTGEATDYRRELNLDSAIATVRYTIGGVAYRREIFSSPVDQVIVIRLTADKPASIAFTASMDTPQKAAVTAAGGDTLIMEGVNGDSQGIAGALKYQARVRVLTEGGRIDDGGDRLAVDGADAALLLISAATSYVNYADVGGDPAARAAEPIAKASGKSYIQLREAHVAEHRRLFRRVSLDLGRTPAADLPTDERIANSARLDDPALAALYFQYARYLLIGCSRPGAQPANLQGLWNESMSPPWGCKYTININTEMNYWPAEPTGLGELIEPLVRMVEDISVTGRKTAEVHYGVDKGWVTHHNTDLWRATGPIDRAFYGTWPTGGAWLCMHLWRHYEYTEDRAFLERIYPILKGSTEFFLNGGLVEEPTHGWLVTNPSISPENRARYGTSIAAGPTMDNQILRDLFTATIQAAEILGVDSGYRGELAAARARLPPNMIGRMGQLQEWLQDIDKDKDTHRHVSHLYGVFPSSQINIRETPDLADAAKVTLNMRGDESTGWAIAWRLNLWARLHDAERAYTILKLLLQPSRTYPNMFDAHPPFQIDGNFGGAMGIAQMILQSRPRFEDGRIGVEIELLPALPAAFATGSISGLRAEGGFVLALDWKDGALVSAHIVSQRGNPCRVRLGDKVVDLPARPGTYNLNADLNIG